MFYSLLVVPIPSSETDKSRVFGPGVGLVLSPEIDPIGCPAPAGSAVLHNGLTAHGAGANMTNKPRRAMTCAYMPDGSTFNGVQNILPPDYFASLKVGDLLNDDVINPKVW